jgi:hypothetical protein
MTNASSEFEFHYPAKSRRSDGILSYLGIVTPIFCLPEILESQFADAMHEQRTWVARLAIVSISFREPFEHQLTVYPAGSTLCVVDFSQVGPVRNSCSGDCYGKADRPFELLAGNRLLGHRLDLEGGQRLRVHAAIGRRPRKYHLVFVVLPRQYIVLCRFHCLGVCCLAQFAEALDTQWRNTVTLFFYEIA